MDNDLRGVLPCPPEAPEGSALRIRLSMLPAIRIVSSDSPLPEGSGSSSSEDLAGDTNGPAHDNSHNVHAAPDKKKRKRPPGSPACPTRCEHGSGDAATPHKRHHHSPDDEHPIEEEGEEKNRDAAVTTTHKDKEEEQEEDEEDEDEEDEEDEDEEEGDEEEEEYAPSSTGVLPLGREIDNREIRLIRQLGRGQYGTVYEGECRAKRVAVKVFDGKQTPHPTIRSFYFIICTYIIFPF